MATAQMILQQQESLTAPVPEGFGSASRFGWQSLYNNYERPSVALAR